MIKSIKAVMEMRLSWANWTSGNRGIKAHGSMRTHPASAAKMAASTQRLRRRDQRLARNRKMLGTSVMQAAEYKRWSGLRTMRAKARYPSAMLREILWAMAKTITQLPAPQRADKTFPVKSEFSLQKFGVAAESGNRGHQKPKRSTNCQWHCALWEMR